MPQVEFGSKAVADTYREEHPDHICPDDDARLKTVTFRSETPEWMLEQAERDAMDSRSEREESTGQVGLSDAERDAIDFSEGNASVPHARAVKGIARDEGVDDWLSYYDPTLTVDEHREVMDRAAREGGGRRMDSEDSALERAGRAARTAEAEQCDHAEGHCKNGDPEACEFLTEVCGFDEDDVETIMDGSTEIPGRIQGARSQLWTRYQVGLANAKEAAAAINEINRQYDEGLVSFEELGDRQLTPEQIDWNAEA